MSHKREKIYYCWGYALGFIFGACFPWEAFKKRK